MHLLGQVGFCGDTHLGWKMAGAQAIARLSPRNGPGAR
jgi:hypothetical protein